MLIKAYYFLSNSFGCRSDYVKSLCETIKINRNPNCSLAIIKINFNYLLKTVSKYYEHDCNPLGNSFCL